MALIPLPEDLIPFLKEYLPATQFKNDCSKPFLTLTYAQSLDSRISKGKGQRTVISHLETKTMTHYLRFHHDGILIGCGTALADDPGLNCKWSPIGDTVSWRCSPRPIIIDPHCKWGYSGSKMQELKSQNSGKSPIIVVLKRPANLDANLDVTYLEAPLNVEGRFDWLHLLKLLKSEYGITSIMAEGGAIVINELLSQPTVVDSLIVTIGAKYLGQQGVEVSPPAGEIELDNITWWKGTVDAVMAARLRKIQC
ncbi:LANO_0C04456g1_1 [Lachancea nothofagi CBS 11611]|uniref:2,5-diamino-6-ribosylamino-4(3H)-pyrimidinone 5'-phosphate reductase n=1 Tax=Lachancea nothofagi CBS 11611 TaxID=1266666 RepID=A0A1G4J6N2_9SACH|nr:LANO_0C04456g1_1 [Lachancea nothofagi CBS 11611]